MVTSQQALTQAGSQGNGAAMRWYSQRRFALESDNQDSNPACTICNESCVLGKLISPNLTSVTQEARDASVLHVTKVS